VDKIQINTSGLQLPVDSPAVTTVFSDELTVCRVRYLYLVTCVMILPCVITAKRLSSSSL